MAKRIFESEKGADMLMNEYTSRSGIKIGKFYNSAIYHWFLPESQVLNVEASYILQQAENGKLDQWELKQSISRGVRWLSQYPIKDCSILKAILLHFTCAPYMNKQTDPRNDHVKKMFDDAEEKLKKYDPDYSAYNPSIANFGEDICKHWDNVWNEKIMYDVISSIVYLCEPQKPITWYDGINFLKNIEESAKVEHGVK